MKRTTTGGALALAILLAACGGEDERSTPAAPAAGLKDLDVTKAVTVDGRKADAETLRTRRINGLWRGRIGQEDVQADFGSDGSLSIMVMRNGSISEQARGTWAWNADNTISGELSGAKRGLSTFSRWSAGFPGTETMLVTGIGSSITLDRSRGAPTAAPGGPGVITADMLRGRTGDPR